MFSSTAYEAFYSYIGIYLHESFIKIITSQEVLIGLLLLILGYSFLMTTWKYFSKYLPGFLGRGKSASGGAIIKVFACFILGISLLKVDAPAKIKSYDRQSWHTNSYINTRFNSLEESYEVSFIFDLLTRSAEELARLASYIVDDLFKKTNSELNAPAAFYKAIMYAGSITIDDSILRDKIDVYAKNCFESVIPMLAGKQKDKMDELFKTFGMVDSELASISIPLENGQQISCLDLKNEVRQHLHQYAETKGAKFWDRYHDSLSIFGSFGSTVPVEFSKSSYRNTVASNALVNHYLSKTEDSLGTQKGAEVEGLLANFFLGWKRFFSMDGFLSFTNPVVGGRDQIGAALTAQRAEKFSEYLQRAPHLKGMVKMFLIALFPWLVFFIVAGRWKVLVSWYVLYVSVLLWTPIWTLLYHLMTSIALSTETMAAFGKFSDGISLYSSSFITSKLYQFYAIYSWVQLIVGPLPTLMLGYGLFNSFLKDSETEHAPESVQTIKEVGVSAVTGGSPAAAAVRKL